MACRAGHELSMLRYFCICMSQNYHHQNFEYIMFLVYLNGYIPVDASASLGWRAWRDSHALCDSLLPSHESCRRSSDYLCRMSKQKLNLMSCCASVVQLF